MVSKTRSFKTPAVTPRSLDFAGELVGLGAKREEIIKHLYRSRSLGTLKLWGVILARLRDDTENGIVWSYLKEEDFKAVKSDEEDLEGVIDELIVNAPDTKVIVLFYEKEPKKICCLVACEISVNALYLTRIFNTKGSKNTVRFCLDNMTIDEAQKKVLDQVKAGLDDIKKK